MPAGVQTVRDCLKVWMRIGRLEKLDQRIAKILFDAVPLNALKKLLVHYSVKIAALGHSKAVSMCISRYYKCSESGREQAVRMFEASWECTRYLDATREELLPTTTSGTMIDIDAVESSADSANTSTASITDPTSSQSSEESGAANASLTEATIAPILLELERLEPLRTLDTRFTRPNHEDHSQLCVPDPLTKLFKKEVNEVGVVTLTLDVAKFSSDVTPTGDFVVPATAPTILGLAEPAFFDVKSCLSTFVISASSPTEIVTQSTTFIVPQLVDGQKVLLVFRSIGTLRDNRQPDLPVGLQWSLNEAALSTFTKVREAAKPQSKDYQNELSILCSPIVLENVQPKARNILEFSFPRRPSSRTDHNCRYQGYVFVATPRAVTDIVKCIPSLPAEDGVRNLLDELRGGHGRTAYDRITLLSTCSVACGKLKMPCKGITCDHPAVFSAEAYLQMNQLSKKPRWKCPRCETIVHWYMLRRDRLMEYLLAELPNCDQVVVTLDSKKTSLLFTGKPEEPDTDDLDDC